MLIFNLSFLNKTGMTQVIGYNYEFRREFSAVVAYEKNRTTKSVESNASKRTSSKEFVE